MIFGEGPIIKNIAGDLNKLFLQGSRVNQPINNVEGDAAADQATIQLMADRDPVIRDISTGLGWAGREVTVSGTGALQLVNSLGRPLKSWSVELAPYQEGSGDPSPENVRPIHGTNKLTITTAGKNQFNWDRPLGVPDPTGYNTSPRIMDTEHYYVGLTRNNYYGATQITSYSIDNGRITVDSSSGGYGIGYPVKVIGSKTYYVSYINISNAKISVGFYDADWNFISHIDNVTYFNAPGNAQYVTLIITKISLTDGPAIAENIQLEFGSSASNYVPFAGINQTVITLPQTVFRGYDGSNGGESGDVNIVYNGTNIQWSTGFGGFITVQSLVAYYNNPDAAPNLLCDIYPVLPYNQATQTARAMSVIYGGEGYLYNGQIVVRDNTITTLSEFITQLTGHQIVCTTSTPTQLPMIASTIPTIEGEGTIWVTAEDGIVTNFSATYLQSE